METSGILASNRKHLRRGVRLSCDLWSDYWDDEVTHSLVDLSPSGGFVETLLPLEKGEEIEIRFTPPRSRALYWLRARVVRTSLGRRDPGLDVPGMGLEFLDLAAGDKDALAAQLRGIPPAVPMRKRPSGGRAQRGLRPFGAEMIGFDDPRLAPLEIDGVVVRALAPMLSY